MENRIRKNPKAITGKQYLILGRPAGLLLLCLAAIFNYIYSMLIPVFYVLAIQLPTEQDIHYTEGLFTYREVGRKYYQIGVKTGKDTEFFSCKQNYLGPHLCEIDKNYYSQIIEDLEKKHKKTNVDLKHKLYEQWQGKPARIGWFSQNYSFLSTKRRVIQATVDGKEVVKIESVKKIINKRKDTWFVDIIISLPFLAGIIYLTSVLILNNGGKATNNQTTD